MNDTPACVNESDPFPHKAEVAAALAAGAHVRRDERELVSSSLLSTYQIRLRIAQNIEVSADQTEQRAQAVEDLEFLIGRLSQRPEATITAWYVQALNGARYVLMEDTQSKTAIGCLSGSSNTSFKADGFAAA